MDPLLFLTIFSSMGILFFLIGLAASQEVTSTVDYFLGGRNLGFLSVTFTLIATQLGGNMLLGTSQWAYEYGIYGMLYALGMSLGFLLLASGFASKLQSYQVATTAELFGEKYNSLALRKFASLISIISLLGILISIVISSRMLINGLGISNEWIFLIFWLFIITYTMLGGLHAVVITDTAQVIFIILCIGSFFIYCLFAQPLGLLSLPNLFEYQSTFSTAALTRSKLFATFLMPALFSLIQQDLAQRFFAARTQRVAMLSALAAGVFIVSFGFIPVYFGMQAHALGIALPLNGNPFIAVTEYLSGSLMFILIVCGVISAITSTADSLLCAISSNVVQDFIINNNNQRSALRISKFVTLCIGLIALIASYNLHQAIIDIAIGSYELSVCCLFVPLMFIFYKKRLNKYGAFGAVLLGLLGFIGFRQYSPTVPKELLTLLLSLIGYLIGDRIKH